MTTGTDTPAPLNPNGGSRVAVIAGGGALPQAVVHTLAAKGLDPFVVVVEGEAQPAGAFAHVDHAIMSVEDFGRLIPRLKKEQIGRLVMAGDVTRRPRLSAIRWSLSTLALIPRVASALRRGDDGLLRAVINVIEDAGIRVIGAHEIVPDLLAPSGLMTKVAPTAADQRDIEAGSEAAIALGRLDIGQGAIAIGGRVIALEGIEGTDGLLERTAHMRGHGRLAGKARGVLVKRCKPQQEHRADLPAMGPATVTAAHAAGLVGIAVEAGRSFILDFDRTVARADELGMFVVGLSGEAQP